MTRFLYLRSLVAILPVVTTGLVAGIMLGTGFALFAARALPETSWTLCFQLDDVVFAKTMIPLFFVALASLIASTFTSRGWVRLACVSATLLFLLAVIITITRNVPINLQVRSWTAGSAPANWRTLRDGWLWSHLFRSIAAFSSFLCTTGGLAVRGWQLRPSAPADAGMGAAGEPVLSKKAHPHL